MDSARSRRPTLRSAATSLLVPVVVAALVPGLASAAPGRAGEPPGSGLGRHDRQLLAEAQVNGKTEVTMLFATALGSSGDVSRGVQAMGGRVDYHDQALGYVRASVPIGRAEQAAKVSGVQAADLDEVLPLNDPRPEGQTNPTPFPAPDASTPRANPYMPIADTGADAFMNANTTWDGRGVTVGVLDTGITLDHPALATTTTGAPKIVDWVTYTHPLTDGDPTWVTTSVVSGPAFTAGGVAYTAPAGAFRFGVFNERHANLGGEVGNDVNRDGNPTGSSGLFGVLWDGASGVRVDVDQDRDFTDEPVMTDYKVNRDVRYFGTDNPATAVAERMPFVVQTDGATKTVNIGVVSGAHGSHVAGIVAANGMFGGAMSGAAPGAQLVSVRVCLFVAGCTAHALIEGMIYAAKQANVDVINMSIGGLPSLNDANNTRAVLYDRLIEQENVQMFISAGNSGPGENTVGDPSVATKVMSVGTTITDATWAANYGSTAPAPGTDNQHPFSSRGPREDGGFKPNITAPGAAISTTPVWQDGGPVAGVHTLPPGYSMFNGTSMASPQAAGAGALLVSAAKQVGVQHQPAQLRKALNSTARFFPEYGAYEQGNGLVQVPAAWSLLAGNLKTVDISSAVPVDTALEQFLARPGIGVGIHDRENVTLGQAYTRQYTFTRTSGAGGSTTYNLSLVGNDGTFSLGTTSISLPKNQPRTLTVSVNPTAYGAHSAILNLDDPSSPGIEYQTLNTVVVARDFTGPGYSHTITGSVARNQALSYFFEVAPGTPAFKVDFTGPNATPGTGQARFLRFHPFGVPIDSNSSLSCYSPIVVPGGSCAGDPLSRTVTNPTPGVWEITVEARRTSDVPFTPFSLTASVLGASVSPNPDVIASATVGVPVSRSYTITNLFGAFTGRATGSTLGSAFIDRPTIANLAQQQRSVVVTAGTTSLRATIGNTSDPAADLDLFVFNCTTGTCVLAGQNADGDSEESVTIANPAAGHWVVLVDGFAVPAGTTQYDYVDVFVNPAFGSVAVTDANALRPAGAMWTVPGTVTANAAPAAGRQLLGQVQVRTDSNALIGFGNVIVQNVTG
ncbi:S8 family serine peptidase [Actinokineospora xionganensis]|uniref:S8 family serine peptidase n=1 Tax=Actinokineospora xionganensis TaxID=2684470 RepID=A0ABR7LD07_9PSEU|nr:S8 family serine peptidase [Actinokineospora xionganensis]MBC6450172.1 S8 family serine peptidase [Actinokineospora xionganensis]